MDLDAQSITSKQFELNRRGYDPDAVDAHLAEVARAVADRERLVADLEQKVASLDARVQDAHESEEALRLTLKAAAHAKEELLATARHDAEEMEAEAVRKTEDLMNAAKAQTEAMLAAAREQAQDLIRSAIAETESLVGRIEELRGEVGTARRVLAGVAEAALPELQSSHQALDEALAKAKESAADATVLIDTVRNVGTTGEVSEPAVADEEVGESDSAQLSEEASVPEVEDEPVSEEEVAAEPAVEPPAAESDAETDGEPTDGGGTVERHLEVVETPESSSEISNKVDRLLEELREVT